VPLQLICGSVGYAIPFWSLGGKKYIETGDQQVISVFSGMLVSGIVVTVTGNITSDCQGSYLAGIGGAFLGAIVAGPIYGGLLYYSNSTLLKYAALSIPPVILSTLFYHLFLDPTDSYATHNSSKQYNQLLINPYISKSTKGVYFTLVF
jgi:hypothetical protein